MNVFTHRARVAGLRQALLGGASLAALSVGLQASPAHAGAPPLSPAWFAQRSSQTGGGRPSAGLSGMAPPTGNGAGLSPQAMQQAQKSVANLAQAARSVVAAQQAQAQAQTAALAAPSAIPNGLGPGGLQPVAGATAGSALWSGANLPTQAASAGHTTVTVKQTSAQAALTWQSFNVGKSTTLAFDQSAGGSLAPTWSVINRLASTSTAPSQILGAVTAPGQVYVINRNGIIFGGGSQVNVGALVASTADIDQTQFQTTGIYSQQSGNTLLPSFTGASVASAITVEPGAAITTNTPQSSTEGGGFVLLMGGKVENDGTISAPGGQVAMAAGQNFILQQGFNETDTNGVLSGNTTSTTLGIEVAIGGPGGAVTNTGVLQTTTGDITMVGHAVTQAGIAISTTSVAQRGTIHLLTNTADPTASVTLAPGSVTMILPDDAGAAPALDNARSNAIANSTSANALRTTVVLNDQSLLPDEQNLSRVEITAGGTVDLQGGSLIEAPAGQVAISTGVPSAIAPVNGSILVENGAVIDVAGLQNVSLPMSANEIQVNIQGVELQDSPVDRDAKVLNNGNVWVDINDLVAVPDPNVPSGTDLFTAGGLLQVSGEVGNIGHSVQEWSTLGGTVAMASGSVTTQAGSLINVAGGTIAYQSGYLKNSYVIAADGNVVNVNVAPANLQYTGIFNGFAVNHSRWGITDTFNGGIVDPAETFVAGYTVGMDAGTVLISAPTVSLQGTIDAAAMPGPSQTVAPTSTANSPFITTGAQDPFQQPQDTTPIGGTLLLAIYAAYGVSAPGPQTVIITDTPESALNLSAGSSPVDAGGDGSTADAGSGSGASNTGSTSATPDPSGLPAGTAVLSAAQLSNSGLASIQVTASQSISVQSPLTLADGGQTTLTAPFVTISQPITAPAGAVTAGNIFTPEISLPDLSTGVVTAKPGNQTVLTYSPPDQTDTGSSSSDQTSSESSDQTDADSSTSAESGTTPAPPTSAVTVAPGVTISAAGLFTNAQITPSDAANEAFVSGGNVTLQSTGPVTLGAGSLINADAGAIISVSGGMTGGNGGNITLIAGFAGSSTGALTLGGTLSSVATNTITGTNKGGTLVIQTPSVVIGTPDLPVVQGQLVLQPGFFQQGFSAYDITGYGNLTDASGNPVPGMEVTPGTTVDVVEPSYQFVAGSQVAPSGTPVAAALQKQLLPVYTANPTTATVSQRPGASIALSAAFDGITAAPADYAPDDTQVAGGGSVLIGAGATVQVDPGSSNSILVQGYGQVTVAGSLIAPGGAISVLNLRNDLGTATVPLFVEGQSVFIASTAVLDAAAQAFVAQDLEGRPFGTVPDGGSITLGGKGTSVNGALITTDAAVIVRPGAVLDASGTSAMIDPLAGTAAGHAGGVSSTTDPALSSGPTLVASNGGQIALRSSTGIFADGTLRAAAGGPGAGGGTLTLALETPYFQELDEQDPNNPLQFLPFTNAIPNTLRVPHELVISEAPESVLPADLAPGDPTPFLNDPQLVGRAGFSAEQFAAGGFSNLSVFVRDILLFDRNVTLSAGQSISLTSGEIAETSPTGQVQISAPVISLAGTGPIPLPSGTVGLLLTSGSTAGQSPAAGTPYPLQYLPCVADAGGACSDGTLTFQANLIQLQGQIRFGISSTISLLPPDTGDAAQSLAINEPGFNTVNFDSTGDIQFLAGSGVVTGTSNVNTDISSAGNLSFTAAQIAPMSGGVAQVYAGLNPFVSGPSDLFYPNANLTISGTGTDPAPPLSAGGSISFGAATILQGGIVRAPLGTITLGAGSPIVSQLNNAGVSGGVLIEGASATSVQLLPGSITSVSAAGETIPDGGTPDGVTYTTSDGVPHPGQQVLNVGPGTIALSGETITVNGGALLDLSGGGTLSGAAFVPGEGGSTDTLITPMETFNPTAGTHSAPSLGAVGVYAIIPGFGSYAPPASGELTPKGNLAPESAVTPGQTVTIAAGIPGLPAGTYTLLPATYALLPGAFRIELDTGAAKLLAGPNALLNGSYQVNAYQGVANTGIRSALPVVATVTSGTVLRTYSQFDEETVTQFNAAQAALTDNPVPPATPADGGSLVLNFYAPQATAASAASTSSGSQQAPVSALSFSGTALFQPAAGGIAGSLTAEAGLIPSIVPALQLEVTASDTPTPGFTGPSVAASQLNAIGAPDVLLGGTLRPGAVAGFMDSGGVIVRDGAELRAAQVILIGPITLEPGSVIDTVGEGAAPVEPGLVFRNSDGLQPLAVVAVSNANLQFFPTAGGDPIQFGVCDANPACQPTDIARLDSEGSINFVTGGQVTIGKAVSFGSAAVTFDVSNINIGSDAALAAANVPAGLSVNQALLATLLAGDPVSGAPPLQSLTLGASQSLNFFGTISLNTINAQTGQSTLGNFAITTPAIYGYGGPDDVATLDVGTLLWSGLTAPSPISSTAVLPVAAPIVMANGPGTGSGTLDINAQQIVFGYPALAQPQSQTPLERTILGFANVSLSASQSISSNENNTLSVYQAQAPNQNGTGFTYSGGTLTITTPLLNGGPGSILAVTAGGALMVQAPQAGAAAPIAAGLGGEIDLTAPSISLDTAVSLPAGKLTATASAGDVVLGPQTNIDLAGQQTALFDQTAATPGGTLILSSASGNVTVAQGSTIDVSAPGANAGSIMATAARGVVALEGTLLGAAPSGFTSGTLTVTTGSMSQDAFDTLNAGLNAGGFLGARSFDIKTGDLDIGLDPVTQQAELQAQSITVSLDGGNLTVDGPVNASGALPGTINLAASGNLTVTGDGVLDAHSTVLQVDSSGQPIDASNTPQVTMTSAGGVLTLDAGAAIDVRSADDIARGQVALNVPRAGDVGIAAAGPVNIQGAASIALSAFQTYTPGTEGLLAGGVITQADINAIGADNTAFMNAALGDASLLGRIAGLSSYGAAFHLRPGVEIDSNAASGGNLTVSGDIDLSGLRYNGLVAANSITSAYGSGEPGVLVLRAADNLYVEGSISDGFAPPPATPDDDGWVLATGVALNSPFIVPASLPAPLALRGGTATSTTFPNSAVLSFDVPLLSSARVPLNLAAGATIPIMPRGSAPVTLSLAGTIGSSFVTTGSITLPNGTVFTAGQTVPAGTVLPVGTVLGTGTSLPIQVRIAAVTWPAGVSLSAFAGAVTLGSNLTVATGTVLPTGTTIRLVSGAASLSLRASDVTNAAGKDVQGQVDAAAPLLPAGEQSWSLQLVAGADLGAANKLTVQTPAALAAGASVADPTPGSITLSDPHSGDPASSAESQFPVESVIRTGTGSLSLVAGGNFSEDSLYGIYTAGAQSADVAPADNLPQPVVPGTNSSLGALGGAISANGATYDSANQDYQANYPTGGGNVLVSAQGTLGGYIQQTQGSDSGAVGNWLFRQGGNGASSAYWINFGTYILTNRGNSAQLVGFTGIGTLGGGNVTITAGGDAGTPNALQGNGATVTTAGIDTAVASTGRVLADGTIEQTGGGSLTLQVGGALNPTRPIDASLNIGPTTDFFLYGALIAMRGPLVIDAGSVGNVGLNYSSPATSLVTLSPLQATAATSNGGPVLVLGDSAASLSTRGDLALSAVDDPTRETQANLANGQVNSWFTLWTPQTGVTLASAGGNVAPIQSAIVDNTNYLPIYPPNLSVVADQGSIFLDGASLELAPAANGQLTMLAGQSILADGGAVDISGANPATLPTPLNPAFTNVSGTITNLQPAGDTAAYAQPLALFTFAPDTPTTDLHAGDPTAALFYAVNGDIIGLTTGQTVTFPSQIGDAQLQPLFLAGKAVRVEAGQDIIAFGNQPPTTKEPGTSLNDPARFAIANGSLILNANASDVSLISAGRDIIEANVQVAGPGNLIVQAGRNLNQQDEGVIDSIGPLIDVNALSRAGGASVTAIAGTGAAGPDYTAFANLYLNPANLADPNTPLQQQPGKVLQTYQDELLAFLQQNAGYTGDASGALAFFESLPPRQQAVFLLPIYFSELNQSGLEETDPTSRFFKSYLRGDETIATLFPISTANAGSLTMFGASGIATEFGGDVNIVVPGGSATLGIASDAAPPSTSGVLTEGSGNVNIYTEGDVTLGQGRVFTTFGGNLLMWSSHGNIAAGAGSKTTVVSAPISIQYDSYGNISLAPSVPSTGAGIATLAPIPSVPPGNLNLVAENGIIDAGEAGIRASGNANFAALAVVNAANIQVQGHVTGLPVVAVPNISALTAGNNVAGGAMQAALAAQNASRAQQPSTITVEVVGYGGGDTGGE